LLLQLSNEHFPRASEEAAAAAADKYATALKSVSV